MQLRRFRNILSRFAHQGILVVGDLMIDHWIWGKVNRISPEAPVPVVEVVDQTFTPGGAANVAFNLHALGAEVGVAGVAGRDGPGRRLRQGLGSMGIGVKGVILDPDRPTTLKTRIIAHSQQVVRADHERRLSIEGALAEKLLGAVIPRLGSFRAILVSDYNKGVVNPSLMGPLLDAARAAGVMVTAGPKPANLPLFSGCALVAMNQKEAAEAAGCGLEKEADLLAAGPALREKLQ